MDPATQADLEAYRHLLAHMREPVLLVSREGTIVASNVAAAEALDAAVATLEGAPLDAYAPDAVGDGLIQASKGVASLPLRARDGRRFACDATALTPDLFVVRLSGGPDAQHRARSFFEMFARLQPIHLDGDRQTLEDVARTLLTVGMTSVDSIAGGVFLLDATGRTLELIGSVGYPPPIVDRYRLVPLSTRIPLTDSARTATPIFLGSREDFVASYAEFVAAHPMIAERAMACIPLDYDGRCIGTLGLGFPLPWPFTAGERHTLVELGRQFAHALERARGQGTARASGVTPDAAASRLEALQAFTGALARAITPAEVAEVAVDAGMAAAAARSGGLWLVADDGRHVSLVRAVGPTGPLPEQHARVPIDRPSRMPILDAIQTGTPVWMESCAQLEVHYPEAFRAFSRGGESSLACIPLLAQGRCIGGLAYNFAGARQFHEDERAFFQVLGWYAAQALERARHFAAEKRARGAAEASHRRSAFLADSDALLASLDSGATLSAVAAMAVPRVADWCIVEVEEDRRRGLPPFAAHIDPTKIPFVLELSRRVREATAGGYGLAAVTRTGKSVLYPAVTHAEMAANLRDLELADLYTQAGLQSSMVVPISARGQTLGAIVLNSATPGRHYDEHDLAMAEDLGRKVGLALENARLYREVRDAGRAKDEFLAMLSHELRNPLVPIVAAVDLMRVREGDAFVYERELIYRNVRHLVRLVDDLLDVSRITRNQIELRKTLIPVADLLAEAAEIARASIDKRGHRLTISGGAGLWMLADRVRMTQAVANLLINAAKFTSPGGKIDITAIDEPDAVVICVRDNGIGIAPEMLPRIFDLFVQASRTIDRSQGGLGIGLTVVKNIVALHGGSVTAHSDGLGHGSELALRLPRASAPMSSAVTEPAIGAGAAPPGKRVLVVEDNPETAAVLGRLLEAVGCTVRIVHDGAAAIALATQFLPEVALLDLGLPEMDGYELARRLRNLDTSLRIVAVTGYGQAGDRARTRAAGFDEHLVKPVELEALRGMLEQS